jgi:hypothetical protein
MQAQQESAEKFKQLEHWRTELLADFGIDLRYSLDDGLKGLSP